MMKPEPFGCCNCFDHFKQSVLVVIIFATVLFFIFHPPPFLLRITVDYTFTYFQGHFFNIFISSFFLGLLWQELWRGGDHLRGRTEAGGQHPGVAPRPEGSQQRGHRGDGGRGAPDHHQGLRCRRCLCL